jgi:hypothetical protein
MRAKAIESAMSLASAGVSFSASSGIGRPYQVDGTNQEQSSLVDSMAYKSPARAGARSRGNEGALTLGQKSSAVTLQRNLSCIIPPAWAG